MPKPKTWKDLNDGIRNFQMDEQANQLKALRQYIQMIKNVAQLEVKPSFNEEIMEEIVKICDSALMASLPMQVK